MKIGDIVVVNHRNSRHIFKNIKGIVHSSYSYVSGIYYDIYINNRCYCNVPERNLQSINCSIGKTWERYKYNKIFGGTQIVDTYTNEIIGDYKD